MGCLGSTLAVFAFFAYLLNSAQNLADEANKPRLSKPQAEKAAAAGSIGSDQSSAGSGDAEEAKEKTLHVINDARLSALLSATRRFAKDRQGMLPPMNSPDALQRALVPGYIRAEEVFQAPGSGMLYLPNPTLDGKALKSFTRPAEIIAFYEPVETAGEEPEKRRTVLFLDGSLRRVTPDQWDILRKKGKLP